MYACVHPYPPHPHAFAQLCLSATESRCPVASCERCLPHNPPPHPRAHVHIHPPVLLGISTGAVSKSNRTPLHRIPLVTSFRFMQAHSVGHFHSFRKKQVRPSFFFFSFLFLCITELCFDSNLRAPPFYLSQNKEDA